MVVRAIREGVGTDMFVKKFKKKCGVRGCKNVSDVFIISRRREMGNTVAMCRECMIDALKSTESYLEPVKVKKEPAPLFPHPELDKVTISSVADEEPEPKEVIEEATEEFPISVAEDTVTADLFSSEKTTAPIPSKKTPPKKTGKSSKKKK
jgi:hypothetical protein